MSDTDYNAITVHPGGEITVNRSYEARYLDCMIEVMQLEDHIAALESENAALREFVAGDDRIQQLWGEHGIKMSHCPDDMWAALNEQQDRRIALAAEHGLPLPDAGEGAE